MIKDIVLPQRQLVLVNPPVVRVRDDSNFDAKRGVTSGGMHMNPYKPGYQDPKHAAYVSDLMKMVECARANDTACQNLFNSYMPRTRFNDGSNKYKILTREFSAGNMDIVSDLFKLYRIVLKNDAGIWQNALEPTLCLSLFMRSDIMFSYSAHKYIDFLRKYCWTQVKMIVQFKRAFPQGNVVVYFDKYFIDACIKMADIDFSVKLQSEDLVDFQRAKTQEAFDKFEARTNNLKFTNLLERVLFYYAEATQTFGVFYVYQFGGPFRSFYIIKDGAYVETNAQTPFESHKSYGYLGQGVRYIALNQKRFLDPMSGRWIERPCHLVYRDGHSTASGLMDIQFITSLNAAARKQKQRIYFLCTSTSYEPSWCDSLNCGADVVSRTAPAGLNQILNCTNDVSIIGSDELWATTVGFMFTLNSTKTIPLIVNERPWVYLGHMKQFVGEYLYGIDEYVLTSLFCNQQIVKDSLYFYIKWIQQISNDRKYVYINDIIMTPEFFSMCVIIYVAARLSLLSMTSVYSMIDIINIIESMRLRGSPLYKSDAFNRLALELGLSRDGLLNRVGIMLGAFPTQYHIIEFLYDSNKNPASIIKLNPSCLCSALLSMVKLKYDDNQYWTCDLQIRQNINVKPDKSMNDMINFYNNIIVRFHEYVRCSNSDLIASNMWCVRPYTNPENITVNRNNDSFCDMTKYDVGFYDAPINRFLIRSPADIDTIVSKMNTKQKDYIHFENSQPNLLKTFTVFSPP